MATLSHVQQVEGSLSKGLILLAALTLAGVILGDRGTAADVGSRPRLDYPFVVTQLPESTRSDPSNAISGGMLRVPFGDGARIVAVYPDRSARVLTGGFHSASDPDVSFDATRILFAAKRTASDRWNVYEMAIDGSQVRQITNDLGDCRSPAYQSTLYTIISEMPWYQLTFVSTAAGTMNEYGGGPATSLYSAKLDGSAVRRLTFNLSSDMDPFIMDDGRLLLASWQRARLERGLLGQVALFGVNIDGADYAVFSADEGRRIKHMPCTTAKGLAVFVEADRLPWDGAGYLSCVKLRRPLYSYRQITGPSNGLFHTPSPLPEGDIFVSRRPADDTGTHGVWRMDPMSGKAEPVFDDPRYHEIQAKLIHPRQEPDGRSSVVTETDPHGKLYCLNVYNSDLEDRSWMPPGSVKRLRVLEGVPLSVRDSDAYLPASVNSATRYPGSTVNGIPPLAQRRILGEIDMKPDGSFNVEIPANTPIELQILDADGLALRSCGWIWAKNHEPRGCIGCHEDGELTPENWLADAAVSESIELCLPPDRRRTVDFRRDVMPIISRRCAGCHAEEGETPLEMNSDLVPPASSNGGAHFNQTYENLHVGLDKSDRDNPFGKYIHPGRARTSLLVWRILGRNTSRPWDRIAAEGTVRRMPPPPAKPLSDDEKRTIVEWIDVGALWDGTPGPDNPTKRNESPPTGANR